VRLLAPFLPAALLSCAGGPAPRWAFDPDREEGVHDDVTIEWWYHFGWLTDEEGGEWASVSSFFRYQPSGGPLSRYLITDLIDLKTGRADYRSRVGVEAAAAVAALTGQAALPRPHEVIAEPLAESPGDPLRLAYGPDRLERTGRRTYRLKVGEVDLELRAVSEPVAVEGTGLTGIESPDDMRYYTIPRLEASGTVRGRKAKGLFWYDHQWGLTWFGAGWSWWGLQLDDGSAVNAYVLRDFVSGKVHRSVATVGDRVYPLEAAPLEWWEARGKVSYPVAWKLALGPFRLLIEPHFKERECPIFGEQQYIWEGPVRVTGSHRGRGFQELVAYARERKR
jgi:predicted secreted hydrolase